jgi:acyl transferase domain-containing protein
MNEIDAHARVPFEGLGIAIVGIAGRFPGASTVSKFWDNIYSGIESIAHLSDDELRRAGVSEEFLSRKDYVRADAFLEGTDLFDAEYFDYSSAEADFIDPQQRMFLECAVAALEDAGCDPGRYPGSIGVFAGAANSTYHLNLEAAPSEKSQAWTQQRSVISPDADKDYLAARVSYKLDLKGPSVVVHTACSTSLVAVHFACHSLLANECDAALAGGVSILHGPTKAGYFFVQDSTFAPDGYCRPFDAEAKGTIFSDGVGVVVLKRLEDAVRDRDRVYGVIRGSAVNNDGASRVSFATPSVDGQAAAIAEALSVANVDATTIQYIETNGTGTALADSIEISALQRAFRSVGLPPRSIAIGSVKANIGHTNTAAGVASLIKATLALHHQCLPPQINFTQPNPQIDFDTSPFYVCCESTKWVRKEHPRRAGVSSFGIGGTNAHVIIEEAPPHLASPVCDREQLLLLSAKTATALDSATENLIKLFRIDPEQNIADAAFTLSTGRRLFPYRRAIRCHSGREAIEAYETHCAERIRTGEVDIIERPIFFMFPGYGTQYSNMARYLYTSHAVFQQQF